MRKPRLGSLREFQLIGDGAGAGTCSVHIGSIFFLQDPFSFPFRVLVPYVGGEEGRKGKRRWLEGRRKGRDANTGDRKDTGHTFYRINAETKKGSINVLSPESGWLGQELWSQTS